MEIKLGQKVKCKASGFTGTAEARVFCISHGEKIDIQPNETNKDGDIQKGYSIDIRNVALVAANKKIIPVATKPRVALGSKVKCNVSGFEGTVTKQSHHMNGCVRSYVEGKYNVKEDRIPGQWIDEPRLEITSVKEEPKEPRSTGGPSVISSSVER